MLVRLIIENKNYSDVCRIISEKFNEFTIIKAEGYWQGNPEHSLIIELDYQDIENDNRIKQIVYSIKKLNNQNKILVQYIKNDSVLL